MTREYLREPMAEIGEDFDENLTVMTDVFRALAQEVSEGVEIELESVDNGGFRLTIEGETVDLADEETLRIVWEEPPEALREHVLGRVREALNA